MNHVFLLGNLGSDPELRNVGDSSVLNMRVATTETWFDRNEQKQERTDWHTVEIWGRRAEGLASFLQKGMKVAVHGSVHTDEYEDRQTGEKKWRTKIKARDVQVGSSGGGGGQQSRPPSGNRRQPPRRQQQRQQRGYQPEGYSNPYPEGRGDFNPQNYEGGGQFA